MNIDIFKHEDNWQDVKDSTMNTIGKTTGAYPTSEWKRRLIMSEHSPIRRIKFYWRWKDLKYWVSVHLVRHKIGIEHWVTTQRTDRTGVDRNEIPQGALVNHACEADGQSMINVSRRRLCYGASKETREAWQRVKDETRECGETELAACMVRECVYRNGLCPEMFSCGYNKTEAFKEELRNYTSFIQSQICDETNINKKDDVITLTKEEKELLLELIFNEQTLHLIAKDKYDTEKYVTLEKLKAKLRKK